MKQSMHRKTINNEATDAAVPHYCNIIYRETINNAASDVGLPHCLPHYELHCTPHCPSLFLRIGAGSVTDFIKDRH